MRRLGLLAAVVAVALLAAGCASQTLGIILTSRIAVTPASAEVGIPIVDARVFLETVNRPQGGSMIFILQYRNPAGLRWNFAGRTSATFFPPDGEHATVSIRYPCIPGAHWRVQVTWDGTTENGNGSAGRNYLPGRFGKLIRKCRALQP